MVWCNMNSCRKVVRPIRNTSLKLCVYCAKQFVRNAQSCGKTNHGFCTMIRHQFTHRCLWVTFWPKQTCNHASTTVFTGLGPPLTFSSSQNIIQNQGFCYNWGNKRKIETEAVGDTKKSVSEVFRGLEKNPGVSVLYLRGGYFAGDKIVIVNK